MGQFNNDYFSFDGIYSRKYGYKIITLDSENESNFGLDRSINKEMGVNGYNIFYGVESNDVTLPVSFCKVDEYNNPLSYTKEELRFISKWLFSKKEPLPFECDGLIYNVIFTKSTRWNNLANKGYITAEMELIDSVAYEPIKTIEKRITGEGYIYLYNDSTATDIIYPNYEFKLIQGNQITITNETTGQIISFNEMKINEKILVDNNIKDMRSESDYKKNIYKLSNKQWLYLENGRNVIKINCTEGDFKLSYQNIMCLM